MKKNVILLALAFLILLIPTILWAECKADFNNDGDVDAQDLAVFASEFGHVGDAGFNYEELSGNTYESYNEGFPECPSRITFIDDHKYIREGSFESDTYIIINGILVMADSYGIRTIKVLERTESEVRASFSVFGNSPVDDTDHWDTDFSSMNNEINNLLLYFITNGWWPGSTIFPDGRVTNIAANHDGKWWIENNVLFIAHPEGDGCVDYKAYELINDRLLFFTDANYTDNITSRKIDE